MNQTSRQEGGHICEPEWFHKVNDEETEDTLEVLKAKADHVYAKHNFVQAGDLYGHILNRQNISMPIFREACEGRVRCLIKNPTQNQDEPQNLAMQLLQKSNPANQEYAMNSYVLLAEVFTSSNSHKLAAGCWIAAISFHPQYPQLWSKLSKTYGELLQENLKKLCLTRAKRLTASFDKNLPESFVKNTYSADISTEKSNQDEDDGFNDLGSSKTRFQKEAEIERRSKLMSEKAHPPPWLSNDEKLEEYLHNFMLSIQGKEEFLSNQK